MLIFNHYGEDYKLQLKLAVYFDGTLALNALSWVDEYEYWADFGTFTKNLNYDNEHPTPEDCAYLDTNNFPTIEDWLKENGFAEPTGETKQSGYCTYPLYRFDVAKIKSLPKDE